ncbi:butyrate kinase [Fusibacter paucivorans]|uniref:Probable butyrate kinase n=1 Tax=Fusibacter paucivorans TaxID=76009 RepID=A0ABS5PTT5_9FIRM|nr:butyrate kinase [Fusibacter paucivorans]MBS7528584.1 butyrate kinase [Fusibacter paucivorans]
MKFRVLAINPGSTSTKVAVYEDDAVQFSEVINHASEYLETFSSVAAQYAFRHNAIISLLQENNISIHTLHAVVGRGGFLKPIASGTYVVNEAMVKALENPWKEHASNLGGLIARKIADEVGIQAYIVDPVVVDEMMSVARFSGLKGIERQSIFHALNQKAVARRLAEDIDKAYGSSNVIIAHLGGGITVGAHQCGKVVDVNNGLDGEGAFSPERSGTLPVGDIIKRCFSGRYSEDAIKRQIVGGGGMVSYFGTNDVREVEALAARHDEEASLAIDAMAYQVSKEIGAMAAVLEGNVDAIALTGGVAYSEVITQSIMKRIAFIAPVHIYPGEDEMTALAMGALRVLKQEEEAKEYE